MRTNLGKWMWRMWHTVEVKREGAGPFNERVGSRVVLVWSSAWDPFICRRVGDPGVEVVD